MSKTEISQNVLREVELALSASPPLELLEKLDFISSNVATSNSTAIALRFHRLRMHLLFKLGRISESLDVANRIRNHTDIDKHLNEKAHSVLVLAKIALLERDFSAALDGFESSCNMFRTVDNTEYVLATTLDIGRLFFTLDDYDTALVHFTNAQELLEQWQNNPSLEWVIQQHIGLVFLRLKEFSKAELYLRNSLAISENNGLSEKIATSYLNLALCFHEMRLFAEQFECLEKSRALYQEFHQDYMLPAVLYSFANGYFDSGDIDAAKAAIKECQELTANQNLPDIEASLCYMSARIVLVENRNNVNASNFLSYINTALDLCSQYNIIGLEKEALTTLAEYFMSQSKWQEASDAQLRLDTVKTKILNESKQKTITTLELRYNYQLKDKENQLLTAEKNTLQLERERLQEKLTMKTNAMLEQLKAVNKLRSEVLSSIVQVDAAETILREVKKKLSNSPILRQDWEVFMELFNQVHPHFSAVLLEKYPKLTKTEVQLCTLIRSGMTTDDIAQFLSLSDRSIENHRLRIRKKLSLKREENLYSTIRAL